MGTSLRLLNIIYTNHMAASVDFYEQLGLFRREDGEVNQWWNEFPIGDATLALHWNRDQPLPTQSNPELHLQANKAEFDTLYAVVVNLEPSGIGKLEGSGRFFTITDPNGVRVQINEAR